MRIKQSILICFGMALALMSIGTAAATEWNVYPGDSIQDAVYGANNGDTIIVHPGVYTENVDVNKELTIKSSSHAVVVADATDVDVFKVTADNVNISGFYVIGATTANGIFLNGVEGCIVTNNILSNNWQGIYLYGPYLDRSSNNNLTGNIVSDNRYGIFLSSSYNNNLTSNTVSNNVNDGIYVEDSYNNNLTSNTVSNNTGHGIVLYYGGYNNLTSNTVSGNYWGILLEDSSNNNLTSNTVSNNIYYGIRLLEASTIDNLIYNNYFNNTKNVEIFTSEINIWNSTEMLAYTYNGSNYVNYTGNYYSDYPGADSDGDGIGDTPYDIPDSSNDDNYPLMFWPVISAPANQPPVADANGPYVGNESTTITFDASGSYDPDGSIVSYKWDLDDDGEFDDGTGVSVLHTWYDDYSGAISVKVTDDEGASDIDTTTVTVNNVAPTVTAVGDVINENDFANVSGTISDPGILDTFDVVIDWGDGYNETFPYPAGSTVFNETHQYLDDDPTGTSSDDYTVSVTVIDDGGGEGIATTTVTVNNVAPNITSLAVLETEPVEVGTKVNLTAEFLDPGIEDTHNFTIDWGDNAADDIDIIIPPGDRAVDANHTYATSGLYNVTFTVEDDDGGSDTDFRYVLVYDPASGSVAGKGSFDSLAGAYVADSGLTGVATFDFNSEYEKGALTGETQFEFDDLNFYSADYEWMVVAGHKATYKGNGTINGEGNYEFLISVIDAQRTSSADTDMFRIKIWNTTTIIYDNNVGGVDTGDYADPITEIEKGRIQIKP
ncbi:parallel beta-helix repeat (two copies) [Methanococcoides vulcani]|uniref:Parallel beta-helix repeat (Two copies) n=2 Tax=Methanococcoides vulcani TaxID=1353158 RepID=A0A1I0B1P5_9EURY|nr:NosD domain-containing protein [Methanococcoides vulcani]SES99864.1 parallel beta-helix repeat (two copies) [Methanococcoides vulcani]